ncbi:MAG: polyprenyl synthetase family protein [Nitrospirae bacterium]|nr:MAG: polyprenyl synthetase family protein [Nitrospirota bacterium]
MDIQPYLEQQRQKIDRFLATLLSDEQAAPKALYDSMRYSLLGGGKRIRPILTLAAAESVGYAGEAVLPYAASLELIHTYSLIHDDLPAMDNDDYRRGRLTNHKVFGEGLAVLAGDALLTMAFELCSRPVTDHPFDPARRVQVIHELALGAGHRGMVGGQVLDIQAENQDISVETLQTIHRYKTGKLIRAAVRIGGILGGASPSQLESLTAYAEAIGLAFQIADDVLNLTGSREELGKDAGTDAKRGKKTYPAFYGIEGARRRADECVARAIEYLHEFDERAAPLRGLATYIVNRRH